MQTLGQKLREERERRGLTIDQVAHSLRISPAYFEAIEADRRDELPGGFFYRSFARQYARLLDMPESAYRDELARALEADIADNRVKIETLAEQRQISVPPMPTGTVDRAKETRKWVIGIILLLVVAAGASGLYKLYTDWRPPETETATASPSPTLTPPVQMPDSQKEAATTPGSAATGTAPTSPADPSKGQTAATPPGTAQNPSGAPPTSTPQTSGDVASQPPSSPATGTSTAPPPSGPVQIALTALDPVWVDVVTDGRRVLTRTLETGETQSFGAGQAIRLRTGNAGGLRIVYNGRAIDAVGPKGQVRTVTFTPQTYEVAQPLPPVGAAPKPESTPPPPQP